MSTKRIVVIGAGGFAREVKWLIREISAHDAGAYEFAGYVVSDLARLGELDSKDEVRGDLAWLRENRSRVDALAIGIGTPAARLAVSRELADFPPDYWPALVHPTARYDRDTCTVGHGVILAAGVIATVNVRFEPFCMVNLACTIGHESIVGPGAVLNPTVNISGGVDIGAGALVGTGAQVLQYLSVGPGAVVGGGSVVTKDVPPGITVVGAPAKPLAKKA